MIYDTSIVYATMLVFTRAGAFIFFVPFLGGHLVPVRLRIAFALVLSIFLNTYHGMEVVVPSAYMGFVIAIFNELIVGALMGISARMVFYVLEMAGHLVSVEVGLMMSRSLNPLVGESYTTVENLFFYFALLVFFTTGLHQESLAAFIRSFDVAAPGVGVLGAGPIELLLHETSQMFILGLQVAAPFMATMFIINLSFAVLGKIAPNVNVFMISFAIRIMVGFIIFTLTTGILTQIIYNKGKQVPMTILHVLEN